MPIYEFDPFSFDSEIGHLTKFGTRVKKFRPKVADLLELLITNLNKAHDTETIYKALWPENQDYTPQRVYDVVDELKEALENKKYKYIGHETRGYCFVGEVQEKPSAGLTGVNQVVVFEPAQRIRNDKKESNPEGLWGGIEGGGRNFIIGVGDGVSGNLLERMVIPTSSDWKSTLGHIIAFFNKEEYRNKLLGIGLAPFGPIGLNPASSDYGSITTTPKKGWQGVRIVKTLQQALPVPVVFTTNANAALYGEMKFGVGRNRKDLSTVVYMCVGIGIGIGIWINKGFPRGIGHPEFGHIKPNLHPKDLGSFEGTCIHHRNCLEGMASGVAIEERWNSPGENLEDNSEAWEIESHYIASGLLSIILMLMPQLVVLAGGVMCRPGLHDMVSDRIYDLSNHYLRIGEIENSVRQYIVPPKLMAADNICESGVKGAIALARDFIKLPKGWLNSGGG